MNRYEIANPKYYGRRDYYTTARCYPALNEIVRRNWSPDALCKFDDILSTHAFNVQNEEMIESIFMKIRLENEYKELLTSFVDVNKRFKLLLANTNVVRRERRRMYTELIQRRDKLEALYGSNV